MRWTHEQFSEMSWHDNHVHALRIVEGAYGAGELLLDLDHIVEWISEPDGCRFKVVPVVLKFLGVTGLRVSLDYATPTAALGPFSIHSIVRDLEPRERYVAAVWRISLNWPKGEIVFEAAGYEQQATGAAVVTDSQYLRPAERHDRP